MKLVLTLFQNCVLNKSYKNVFSHARYPQSGTNISILDKYLDTLKYKSITLNDTYYENTGTLVFDFSGYIIENNDYDIYSFNYMRCIQYDDSNNIIFKRYCFIDKIEIKNDVVYLTYSEDIWSSYGNKIKGCTASYLSHSRFHDYNDLNLEIVKLPVDYDGNDMLRVELDPNREVTKVNIYAQVQLKVLDSEGNPTTNLKSYIVRLKYIKIDNVTLQQLPAPDNRYYWKFTNSNIQNYISSYEYAEDLNYLLLNQSYGKAIWSDERYPLSQVGFTKKYAYEIGKIWCVPYEWSVEDDLDSTDDNNSFIGFNYDDMVVNGTLLIGKIVNYRRGQQRVFKIYNIQNNYRNLYIGTLKTHVVAENNGTAMNLELRGYADNYNFSIMMNLEGNILDITSDFEIEIPFTAFNAETTKQALIARRMEIENLNFKSFQNEMKIIKSTMSSSKSMGDSLIGMFGTPYPINIANSQPGFLNIGYQLNNIIQDTRNFAETEGHLTNLKNLINAPVYSTTKMVDINNANILNGIYGLLIFRMTLDNENFVKNYIKNFGYEVCTFVDDWRELNLNDEQLSGYTTSEMYVDNGCYFNVLQFTSIDLYGSFTGEIAKVLNEIFRNGVKIWFINSINENDNYDI